MQRSILEAMNVVADTDRTPGEIHHLELLAMSDVAKEAALLALRTPPESPQITFLATMCVLGSLLAEYGKNCPASELPHVMRGDV